MLLKWRTRACCSRDSLRWRCGSIRAKRGEEDDREPLPYDLGYQVLSQWLDGAGIAESAATDLWQDVLKGSAQDTYHHLVGSFPRSFVGTVARA